MADHRSDQGKLGVLEKDIPEHQKLTHDTLCGLISEATNFTKADIKKVLAAYHKTLCQEFGNGKRYYDHHGYIKIRLQRQPEYTSSNWGRGPIIVPERDKFVVRVGSTYNIAIDYMNHKTKKAIAGRAGYYKKKGDLSRP